MATPDIYEPPDIPNGPGDGPSTPEPPDPWSTDDLAAATAFYTDYITQHHIETWGEPADGVRTYESLRRTGLSHEQALQAALHTLGWDQASAPTNPTNPTNPTTPTTGPLGSLLQPFDETFSPAPSPAPFQYPDFVLPSGQQVLDQDPGYGFRVNQGMQALTNSAAAKHQLRTGATLKNFLDFGQQLGSQEYGNAVDRLFSVWNANRGNQFGIYNAGVDKSKLDWQHGFDVWNQDFNIFKWNKTFPYTVLHDQQLLGADAAAKA